MATTAEYASVEALVCTVGGNSVALKDMEKSGNFKVSGMHVTWEDQRESFTYSIYTNVQYILQSYICIVNAVYAYLLYIL